MGHHLTPEGRANLPLSLSIKQILKTNANSIISNVGFIFEFAY